MNISKENRIGKTNINNFGSKMVVVGYKNSTDVLVKFLEHGNTVRTQWVCFCRGTVKNPYDRSVFSVGYLGEGSYKATEKGNKTKQYLSWRTMLERCYSEAYHQKQSTYKDATVSEEWHNFQNFAKWHDQNYYEIEDQRMELDKDILVKGNKVYSLDTCIFVPHRINSLFVKNNANRGSLPIGVMFRKGSIKNPYEVYSADINSKPAYVGVYNNIDEAFKAYKDFRENVIKVVAEDYKSKIPIKLYNALITYEVEIDD